MRRTLVVAVAVAAAGLAAGAGCKGKHGTAGSGSGSGAGSAAGSGSAAAGAGAGPALPIDWKACDAALRKAATEPLDLRPAMIIAGCEVCGPWKPLLEWNVPQTEKGPTRLDIEHAMARCGYCSPNGKQRFLGTLDNARGTNTRTPWRMLGEQCKGDVSALPDNRFTSAPFYALDRIARAASARGGDTANLLAAIEVPLPAVSVTGVGMVLADLDSGIQPTAGPLAITLIGGEIHVAKLPRARLGAGGVAVDLGNYPGDAVKLVDLGGVLGKLAAGDKTASIALVVPFATPAEKLVPIVAAASTVAPVYLAVNAPGAPLGWDLPGTVPVALEAGGKNALAVTPEMTVQNLATELGKRARSGQKKLGLAAKK
jgi:hypothetical protein